MSINSTHLSDVIFQSFPRVGGLVVNSSVRVEYDNSTGQIWDVDVYTVTFSSREDLVPTVFVDTTGVKGLLAGDHVSVVVNTIGGSLAPPSIQSWSIKQSSTVRAVQRVSISAPVPVLEVQEIVLTSNNPISGYFTLSYDNVKTSLISNSATAFVVEAALRTIASIGNLQVTRRVGTLYGFTWTVRFLTVSGKRPTIGVQVESLSTLGSSLSLTTNPITQGSQPLGGNFTLKSSGHETTQLALDASALTIQSAIEHTLNITGVSVTIGPGSTYAKSWDVTFPLSAGNIYIVGIFVVLQIAY